MRVGILSYALETGSGAARASINFARGLRSMNVDVEVISLWASQHVRNIATKYGIMLVTGYDKPPILGTYRLMLDLNLKLAKKLLKLLVKRGEFDVHVVIDDGSLSVASVKGKRKMVLWSQGDLVMSFFSSEWNDSLVKSLAGYLFMYLLRNHRNHVQNFDLILANSKLAKEIMQFTYERLPIGIVYPPVDVSFFKPIGNHDGDFILAVGRKAEAGRKILEKLAKKAKLVTVGGITVNGAKNLGFVSEEQLRELYCNAYFTVHSVLGEYFGYPVVESMACGTPVLAFNSGGPSEIIIDGKTGWLANSECQFINKALEILRKGYPETMREKARRRAERFSIEHSCKNLLKYLKALI